jgi:hypothetical protein
MTFSRDELLPLDPEPAGQRPASSAGIPIGCSSMENLELRISPLAVQLKFLQFVQKLVIAAQRALNNSRIAAAQNGQGQK